VGVQKTYRSALPGGAYTPQVRLIKGQDFRGCTLGRAIIPLTAAQLTTLYSAPVAVIPAPYSTQIILVSQILFQFKYPASGGVQFTGGGAVTFPYHGTSTNVHSGSGIAATVLQAAANSLTLLPPPSANLVLTADPGLGVDISAASADFAAGNATAIVTLYYSIVSTTFLGGGPY
jgi:hypothetical protein